MLLTCIVIVLRRALPIVDSRDIQSLMGFRSVNKGVSLSLSRGGFS